MNHIVPTRHYPFIHIKKKTILFTSSSCLSSNGFGLADEDRWCNEDEIVRVTDRSCCLGGTFVFAVVRKFAKSFLFVLLALLCHDALIISIGWLGLWNGFFVRCDNSSIFACARARRNSTARFVWLPELFVDGSDFNGWRDNGFDVDGVKFERCWRNKNDLFA
jgi:hypothetical protein